MLSQNMTDKIIDYIMSHGGDFAEVFAEHTRRNQLAMTGGNMSEALAGIESVYFPATSVHISTQKMRGKRIFSVC